MAGEMNLLPAFTQTRHDSLEAFTNKVFNCDALDLLASLPDASVDMVLCDLPYGVTVYSWDSVIPLDLLWAQLKRVIKRKGAIVLTATEPFASQLRMSNLVDYRYDWIWKKSNSTRFLDCNRMPLLQHETVLIFGKSLPNYYPQMTKGAARKAKRVGGIGYVFDKKVQRINTDNDGTRYPKTVLEFAQANSTKSHPNEKPVALFEYLIKTYTQSDEIVLDMTCGGGTTAVAARKIGRRFICGDSSAEYVEISNHRLASSDPYQHKDVGKGLTQLSLFARL